MSYVESGGKMEKEKKSLALKLSGTLNRNNSGKFSFTSVYFLT